MSEIESIATVYTVAMPELPEVETVKRGLERLILNKTIIAEKHDWDKGFPNAQSDVDTFLVGAQITAVGRRGKALIITLNTGYSLLIHLKMTGQLVFVGQKQNNERRTKNEEKVRFGAGHPNESLVSALPDKSTRVTLSFKDGSHLFFNDQRKFGWMKLLSNEAVEHEPFIQKLGPEPLEEEFTNTIFVQQLGRRQNTSIKAALLDQTVLAGVGNIYADEALWAARIHPSERVKNVDVAALNALHKELVAVLKLSIKKGGSTDRNYVNAEGKKGSYISFAKVFRREGEPCERCGSVIEKSRVAGRGTHTCPACQTVPSD